MERIQRLIAALWFGSAFFLTLATAAVFRAAPTPSSAADMVGAMLTRWHYIALAAPLALFGLELRRVRPVVLTILFSCLLFATAEGFIDLRIRSMRWSTSVPISELHPSSPLRRSFARLHGASMALLALQTLAAAIVVMASPRASEKPAEPAPPAPPAESETGP